MFKGKKILSIIPARGGSKGIPLKNIQKLDGITLIEHVAKVVKEIDEIDRSIVSTDHKKIVEISNNVGLETPFIRPDNLSGDFVSDLDVLMHAYEQMKSIDGIEYDIILMLQPTSPLRKSKHVLQCIKKLVEEDLDSVWTVSETDSKNHPMKQLSLNDNGKIDFYEEMGNKIIARQQLDKLYHRNGIAYVMTKDCLMNQKSIIGRNNAGIVIEDHNISIDTAWDLELVEYILSKR